MERKSDIFEWLVAANIRELTKKMNELKIKKEDVVSLIYNEQYILVYCKQKMIVTEEQAAATEQYNDEPVYYCKHCLSLAIKDIGIGDCCADCGSMIIGVTTLEGYDRLYKARFGKTVFYK